jgi:hypothetical protein
LLESIAFVVLPSALSLHEPAEYCGEQSAAAGEQTGVTHKDYFSATAPRLEAHVNRPLSPAKAVYIGQRK